MKLVVVGAGAWGRAFGEVLRKNGHEVKLIDRADSWPTGFDAEMAFLALPAQVTRKRLMELAPPPLPWVSLSKGVEIGSGLRMSQVLSEVVKPRDVAALSGPCLAPEVAKGLPTAVVVASENEDFSRLCQEVIQQKGFRTYRSTDLTGVEIGGAMKNVFAIAAGVCFGIRAGENALAALVTRSLAEMVRVGVSLGAKKETLFGLSGAGDLMLTCYSRESRNHRVGEHLAKGEGLQGILSDLHEVAEGVPTTKALRETVQRLGIQAPILYGVHGLLYEGKSPGHAVEDLLTRSVSEE